MRADQEVYDEMMTYYDQRAAEYDELYRGEGTAALDKKGRIDEAYALDVAEARRFASSFGKGHIIDIACGTGFWIPSYQSNCEKITALDQSQQMLRECGERVESLDISAKVSYIHGDLFDVEIDQTFDAAVLGFILSHLLGDQETQFFARLHSLLRPGAQLLFIDGAWNDERKKSKEKEGVIQRVLNDGRRFRVVKRYFEERDVRDMFGRYGFKVSAIFVGRRFIAAKADMAE
jgi:ubiquinone/menaquinone biosynthesis C-methylase UbiE